MLGVLPDVLYCAGLGATTGATQISGRLCGRTMHVLTQGGGVGGARALSQFA